jgi:protein-S-isoprenylcysteine O-methyltransferase Ste14
LLSRAGRDRPSSLRFIPLRRLRRISGPAASNDAGDRRDARVDAIYVPSQRLLELNLEIKRLNRLRLRGSRAAGLLLVFVTPFADRNPMLSDRLVEAGGTLLIAVALGIRLWALGSIDGNKKRVLVTWGPYRYVRHPLYCSSILFALGVCLIAGSWTAVFLSVSVFLVCYLPVLRAEEQFLAERFGAEWDAYCQQTRILLPRIGTRFPKVEGSLHLRRPWREIATLILLPLVVYITVALIHYLDRQHDLSDWFF